MSWFNILLCNIREGIIIILCLSCRPHSERCCTAASTWAYYPVVPACPLCPFTLHGSSDCQVKMSTQQQCINFKYCDDVGGVSFFMLFLLTETILERKLNTVMMVCSSWTRQHWIVLWLHSPVCYTYQKHYTQSPKINTKATLKCPLHVIRWCHKWLKQIILDKDIWTHIYNIPGLTNIICPIFCLWGSVHTKS